MFETYWRRPLEVEAVQWDGRKDSAEKIIEQVGRNAHWFDGDTIPSRDGGLMVYPPSIVIDHLEDSDTIYPGGWIVHEESWLYKGYSDEDFKERFEN